MKNLLFTLKKWWNSNQSLMILLGVVLVSLSLGFYVSRTVRFRFSEIKIHLNGDEDSGPIHSQKIKNQLLSDLGKNLHTLSLPMIERKILSIPSLENVKLRRHWPSTIVIYASIKKPVALTFVENTLWSISKDGKFIESVKNPPPLPLLIGFEEFFKVRTSVQRTLTRQEIFSFLFELHQNLSELDADAFLISEVHWQEDKGLVLWSNNSELSIELGFDNFKNAWIRGREAVRWANSKNISLQSLDASYDRRVVLSPRMRLQNLKNELNLEELVQKKDTEAAAAR